VDIDGDGDVDLFAAGIPNLIYLTMAPATSRKSSLAIWVTAPAVPQQLGRF
jgi:hypothetical protein